MEKIKMKLVGYDPATSSLQIKFAGENAEKPIDEYDFHNFSVLEMHENVAISDILRALAQNGYQIALQQELAETIARNDAKVGLYKSLIGTEIEYTAEQLFPPVVCVPSENQPLSTGLQVI